MKITKYEHACLVIEEQGKRLVIDPGKFSNSLPNDLSGVVGIVITHVHSDHFDIEKIKNLLSKNSELDIFSTEQVKDEMKNEGLSPKLVKAGDKVEWGGFVLEFFGGNHELYKDFQNIAVLVNKKLYHPGDSYTKPNLPVEVLAAPASAPWLRVTEASDFITAVRAKTVFPIHNSLLSEIGESIHYRILGGAAESVGSKWVVLKPGEPIDV